jgi:glycosyltransferase involved in cell wall biosynthesis
LSTLVSIIIPTYNRAYLIGETLESIVAQTYTNWECIVVDDGSEDYTEELLKFYCKLDSRILFYKRPKHKRKGANACRNFGFEKGKGNYIIWFDSDDLMTSDHIENKVEALEKYKLDFIVAKTQNFKNGKMLEPYVYEKKPYGIKASDFILLKIHWYTYDVILTRIVAEKISWNQKMKSWQDYNYFCKMLLESENGAYLDEILTHRRLHTESIQKKLTVTKENFKTELLENRLLTFKDIQAKINPETKIELIYGVMNLCYGLKKYNLHPEKLKEVNPIVKKNLGLKSLVLFNISLLSVRVLKHGFFLLEKAKRR